MLKSRLGELGSIALRALKYAERGLAVENKPSAELEKSLNKSETWRLSSQKFYGVKNNVLYTVLRLAISPINIEERMTNIAILWCVPVFEFMSY